jgi:hypothetical protein
MFFDPPPEPAKQPEPKRRAEPSWLSRPHGVLLAGVPLELVLAREPRIAVALSRLGACPDGFEGELTVLATSDLEDDIEYGGLFGAPWRRRGKSVDPARSLRFGARYADGSKAELGGRWEGREGPPPGPVIHGNGGSGGRGEWRERLWFWPLPPAGPIAFALEWLEQGIELRLHELDAAPIREAAGRAQTLMLAEDLPDTPGYTSHAMRADPSGGGE